MSPEHVGSPQRCSPIGEPRDKRLSPRREIGFSVPVPRSRIVVDSDLLSAGTVLSSQWFTRYAGKPERPLADYLRVIIP